MAILGTDLILYYRGTGGTNIPFAASTNCSFNSNTSQLDVTSASSAWFTQYKNDTTDWNITCDGLITIGDYDHKDMLETQLNRTKINIRLQIGTASQNTVYGSVYIESINLSAPVEGVATYSISLKGTGPFSFNDPSTCSKFLVTITTAPAEVQYVDCDTFNTYTIFCSTNTTFYQCAKKIGGLAQIFIISGDGTISPVGLCNA